MLFDLIEICEKFLGESQLSVSDVLQIVIETFDHELFPEVPDKNLKKKCFDIIEK
jgi:hypothetical protein